MGSGRFGSLSLLAISERESEGLRLDDMEFSGDVGSGFESLDDDDLDAEEEPAVVRLVSFSASDHECSTAQPPGASLYKSCPTDTVSSSLAKISTIVPAFGALIVTSICGAFCQCVIFL